MAESNFSWLKIASFFGALLLVVLAIVSIGMGINLVRNGNDFYGCASICSGIISFFVAVLIYRNYQKKGR